MALLLWLGAALPGQPVHAAAPGPLANVARQIEAKAASQPASAPDAAALGQSLDQVIGTLQNDVQRRALVEQLQTMRRGLDASAAAASAAEASAATPVSPGLIGAVVQTLTHVDESLHTSHGPIQYWRWRSRFAAEEWQAALTGRGSHSAWDALREFATVLGGWALCGWVLWELARRVRARRLQRAERARLPAVPSWRDVGIYMLRRIGPWIVAFAVVMVLAFRVFTHSPASVAAVLVGYAIVSGAVFSAVCQVIFALFTTAHRTHAVRDLHAHSQWLLFMVGALAALGDGATDGRVVAVLGTNLAALVSTAGNISAAVLIAVFATRFRRPVGQLLSLRPLAYRQEYPARVDLLRMAGDAWHMPVLAVVIVSVMGTLFATGNADVFLRRTVASVALLVAALMLTLVVGRSPHSTARTPRFRDRQRSAYLSRFGRFAVALLRIFIWFGFAEAVARVWGTSVIRLVESTPVARHVAESTLGVVATVVVTWLVWLVIDTAINQTLSPGHGRTAAAPSLRVKTILPLVRNATFVTLLVVALIVVLANLGVNVTPLLAGAGVVGLAIGFGAQSLVQDLITGLFIVIEDSIAIGDSIELPDHAGTVEAMTIRTVKLRDGKGALHTLPYSQIKIVKNLSRGWAYAVFNIGITYQSDLDRALDVIRSTGAEIALDHRYARNLLSGLDILGLDRFDPSGPVVMAQFKTRPLTQAEITRAFNRRLKRNFDGAGIAMAGPSLTIQMAAMPAGEDEGLTLGRLTGAAEGKPARGSSS